MSARLSRRFGALSYHAPLLDLPAAEKPALSRLTEQPDTEFEHLPPRYQRLIVEAEANMRRQAEAAPKELAGSR